MPWPKTITLLAVFAGGGAGSVLRFLTGEASARWLGAGFPFGTFLVNAAGTFLAGVLSEFFLMQGGLSPVWRAGLMAGFLGGFTTYSAFNTETLRLMEKGALGLGALTVLVCGAAGAAGMALARGLK